MGFYTKFSENDLIESYKNQIDYQGKPSEEILEEILKRGSLEKFQAKIDNNTLFLNEVNRVIRETHHHYMNNLSMNECLSIVKSDMLNPESVQLIVKRKYEQIHVNVENLKLDSKTWTNSLIGAFIASIISSILIFTILYQFIFLSVFAFALLIPLYIINYWIIRLITGKTRDNLAVFIGSFIATVLNCIYFAVFIYYS
ncbi:hypothetical protein CEY12_16565 [Chryseobacterium sp. T16E-39]|uniref:hypothetical protein n=1 Tax=Chryseobacterium sp. T16E-39 TaxID=2015076 RepID=UPI000B5B2E90|nr:hypothetical protein [Chryseobacterium sp. T16E-39]ASK31625.1 hypothetical protein CEY12_16565 [Chryseobacterium sp. T16E-39]